MRVISGALCVLLTAATGHSVAAAPENGPRYAPQGVYGRVDISGLKKKPKVINKTPVVADRAAMLTERRGSGPAKAAYLFVPRAYYTHWAGHCMFYNACTEPVHFIDHDWYYKVGPGRGMPYREGERRDHKHEH